ncbi:signal peptidase I [Amycolatopsis coloradensis]|uniref:Signal peptidase I n=1 Tax=Amycolatopsis coloradensis TaxID=76021 RepID=A0A1R0KUH3_9PSEU|nr:signal peptidase I [Amycolatopsis coloradensis]OLZ51750.1 signal peptidase I [Amycolatopsis coloradensis]
MGDRWYFGNAEADGRDTRGWILGHFLSPSEGVRSSRDVEIKWGTHDAGETRPAWTRGDERTTAVILIEGCLHIALTTGEVHLQEKGDYVVWGPGIDHSWTALTDATVLTVRWPSTPP